MKTKTLLIMGLLSFGLAGCANAQNKQGNSNVKELTKEQKEKLKEMYEMYQYFQIKPGISENVTVKERSEPLPWIEMQKGLDWSHVKDWLSNAKLEVYAPSGVCWLSLHGKAPYMNCTEDLQCVNKKDSMNTLYELTVEPSKILGNMGLKFTSHLQNVNGDFLGFSQNPSTLLHYMNEQELNLLIETSCDNSIDCKSSIEVELLPPLRWKHTRISLLPEDEGKEYEFDGVRFKVFKSNPGDVILEYDEKYAELMDKGKLILIKGQQLIDRDNQMMSGGKEILQLYKHPDMGFGGWCIAFMNLNCKALETTPEALKLATENHYQPTPEELRRFHETSGEMVGCQLTDILNDINPKNYKEFYQQWVEKGYEAAIEFKGSDIDAMGCFYERYGNDSEPYIAFLRGVSIGSSYVKANLKPDWNIINSCAIDFLNKYNSAGEDSLYSLVKKHIEEYIEPIVSRRETLSFLTDKDIKFLSKDIVEDESPIMYCWYKTNTDADAMYIYKPDETTSDKPLIKVRYYLGGDKPEIIYSE